MGKLHCHFINRLTCTIERKRKRSKEEGEQKERKRCRGREEEGDREREERGREESPTKKVGHMTTKEKLTGHPHPPSSPAGPRAELSPTLQTYCREAP